MTLGSASTNASATLPTADHDVRRLRLVVVALAGTATLLKLGIAANTFGTDDVHYWTEFAQGVRSFGPVGVYGHSFFAQYNHPPLAGWMLWVLNGLAGHDVASFTFLIRAPASIADLFTGLLVFELVRARRSARIAAASAVLVTWSPVLFVISGFHGNTDPVFVMLTLLSLYLLVDRRRPFASGVSLALALSVKLVPVVVGPVFLLVLLRQGGHRLVVFARGFAVGELVIQHRARKFGSSKYGWKRFIKGGLDVMTVRLLTGFGRRPQHFIGAWGLGFAAVALSGFALLVVNLLVRQFEADAGAGPFAQVVALILSVGLGLLGSQCLLAGLLAEMTVARKWLDNDPYSVAERAGE